jgi:hypothetical protein
MGTYMKGHVALARASEGIVNGGGVRRESPKDGGRAAGSMQAQRGAVGRAMEL